MNSGVACTGIYWSGGLFGILNAAQNHLKRKQLKSDPNYSRLTGLACEITSKWGDGVFVTNPVRCVFVFIAPPRVT